jgi:formylglycine-generating enzyme required for sulfatase activity
VGQKAANGWGLYDTHGNVSEWCADWYGHSYKAEAATNPQGPTQGYTRVLRGGSWNDSSGSCRSAFRIGQNPDFSDYFFGFRVVLEMPKRP